MGGKRRRRERRREVNGVSWPSRLSNGNPKFRLVKPSLSLPVVCKKLEGGGLVKVKLGRSGLAPQDSRCGRLATPLLTGGTGNSVSSGETWSSDDIHASSQILNSIALSKYYHKRYFFSCSEWICRFIHTLRTSLKDYQTISQILRASLIAVSCEKFTKDRRTPIQGLVVCYEK
jgi:hypothetical protein